MSIGRGSTDGLPRRLKNPAIDLVDLLKVRARLLSLTEQLDKAGRNSLADDIKQQIATFALKITLHQRTAVLSCGWDLGR